MHAPTSHALVWGLRVGPVNVPAYLMWKQHKPFMQVLRHIRVRVVCHLFLWGGFVFVCVVGPLVVVLGVPPHAAVADNMAPLTVVLRTCHCVCCVCVPVSLCPCVPVSHPPENPTCRLSQRGLCGAASEVPVHAGDCSSQVSYHRRRRSGRRHNPRGCKHLASRQSCASQCTRCRRHCRACRAIHSDVGWGQCIRVGSEKGKGGKNVPQQ